MKLICSYLEIKVAFELLKLAHPDWDISLIYGGTYRITTIDDCPYRYCFQEKALIKVQLNRPQQNSQIISSFEAICSGKDSDFIFVPVKNCPIFFSIKKQRNNYPFIQRLVTKSENQQQKVLLKQQ